MFINAYSFGLIMIYEYFELFLHFHLISNIQAFLESIKPCFSLKNNVMLEKSKMDLEKSQVDTLKLLIEFNRNTI